MQRHDLSLPAPADALSRRASRADLALWIRTFVRSPRTVASIAPSSQRLAEAVVSRIEVDDSTQVLELGVGTGALTRALRSRGVRAHQYTGVELQADLVAALRSKYPDLTFVHDSAHNLPRILRARRVAPTQVVASLPWSTMRGRDRRSCLAGIAACLRPGGQLLTYSYLSALLLLPAGRRTPGDLAGTFARVSRSAIVWRNLPPAMVWTCSR